jgi:hypothetical protein
MAQCKICQETSGKFVRIAQNYWVCEGCLALIQEKLDQKGDENSTNY